jgi:hypothetical protein
MVINVIHDNRLMGRYEALMSEFANENITDYKIWEPVEDRKSVVTSINLSHKRIVAWAKSQGLKDVCIGEDDLCFSAKGGWQHFLSQKPEVFDVYLWGSFIVPLSNNCVCGFQLYIMSEKFYDKFLSSPIDTHIDTYLDNLKGDYKFCYPFSVLQRVGWSANNKAITNYNSALREEDIWKGNHSSPTGK